ncbi:hypothetical protein [Flagellimonas spongiicola]|nr:hypothetical protein [Allomuricauda spongiicola]
MKTIAYNLKKEFASPQNRTAAISCLVISLTVFFIMAVLNREVLL